MKLRERGALATLRGMPIAPARSPGPARLAVLTACALALGACHHAPPPASNVTPERAVATSLALTAHGKFDALAKNRLPPPDYAQWRSEWEAAHAKPAPVSEAQRKQFATIMHTLTEPGAEARLLKRVTPELARLRGQNNSLPIASGILEAAGKQMIADSPQLGDAQRALASEGLKALSAWARNTDFSDPRKAQKAVELICTTARALHVETLDQWQALDYAATMKNYGIIWNGLERLLGIYGLQLAQSLADATTTATATGDDHATIKLEMQLAERKLSGEWPMVKQDGHWYDEALLAAWHKAHPAPTATAATPANGSTGPSAGSVGAPAAPMRPPSHATHR